MIGDWRIAREETHEHVLMDVDSVSAATHHENMHMIMMLQALAYDEACSLLPHDMLTYCMS